MHSRSISCFRTFHSQDLVINLDDKYYGKTKARQGNTNQEGDTTMTLINIYPRTWVHPPGAHITIIFI